LHGVRDRGSFQHSCFAFYRRGNSGAMVVEHCGWRSGRGSPTGGVPAARTLHDQRGDQNERLVRTNGREAEGQPAIRACARVSLQDKCRQPKRHERAGELYQKGEEWEEHLRSCYSAGSWQPAAGRRPRISPAGSVLEAGRWQPAAGRRPTPSRRPLFLFPRSRAPQFVLEFRDNDLLRYTVPVIMCAMLSVGGWICRGRRDHGLPLGSAAHQLVRLARWYPGDFRHTDRRHTRVRCCWRNS
jgi:hypothetical protein